MTYYRIVVFGCPRLAPPSAIFTDRADAENALCAWLRDMDDYQPSRYNPRIYAYDTLAGARQGDIADAPGHRGRVA